MRVITALLAMTMRQPGPKTCRYFEPALGVMGGNQLGFGDYE
ncbi:hypothetical protein [Synechococcus sp. CBW1108]|nr:hypothetical protein [Synechococcus sp. CBW1108]